MKYDEIVQIQFPLAYPNMYIQPLESFMENGKVSFNPDILSLVQELREWAGTWAITEIFDMEEFLVITDCYQLLNDENIDILEQVEGVPRREEKFSTLDPKWFMDLAMKTWDDEPHYYKQLKKSKDYLEENYIIESKVLIFPSKIFGPSDMVSFKRQDCDYLALKFWQLNNKMYVMEDLTGEQKEFIGISNAPIIIFMGLFKLNISTGVYQIPTNMSSTYNPTRKALVGNIMVENYEKGNRLYLAVNRAKENKNKLDMSVIRDALKHNLVDGKIGILNIDNVTYEIKKI